MSNSVVYDAHSGAIHSVTVFQQNRADINRRIEVEVKKGQNQVIIKHLPSWLDQDSIRVDGIGDAVIFDVVYKPPSNYYSLPEQEQSDPALQELQDKRAELQSDLEIAEKQSSILEDYSNSVKSEHSTAEQLSTFLKTYAESQRAIAKQRAQLQKSLDSLAKEIVQKEKENRADPQSLRRQAGVVIVVLAGSDGPVELSLTYSVSGASWTPLYDVRADIGADDSKPGNRNKIDLHYRASIFQSTAEDWTDVQLTLSTASPQTGSSIPTLTGQSVAEDIPIPIRPPPISFGMAAGAAMPSPASAPTLRAKNAKVSRALDSIAPQMQMMQMQQAVARTDNSNQGFSSTFLIDGLSTIPSDTDSSAEKHKVTIAVIELKNVDLEWVTVPKSISTAFLRCKVKNTSEYILLPGEASVFMNNNFVSKSAIPIVSPQEYFNCSFGADSSIRVTYHPQSKMINLPTGSILGNKTISTAYSQRITIKNTRQSAVGRLLVRDQVPVSNEARIKVNVSEPNMPDISSGLGLKEVGVTGYKNVTARWAPVNEDEQGPTAEPNREGFVEWICKLEPNSSTDLVLNWEINTPKELKWKLT